MNWAKDQYQRQIERGLSPIRNKYVCSNHFGDPDVKRHIDYTAESDICSYCEREADEGELLAAPIDDVLDYLVEAIRTEYGLADVDEIVAYDPEEDNELWGTTPYDGIEVLTSEVGLEIIGAEVEQDIQLAMEDGCWVEIDPYGPRAHEVSTASWRRFMDVTRSEKREGQTPPHRTRSSDEAMISVDEMLKHVLVSMSQLESTTAFKVLPVGTTLYRSRTGHEKFATAAELGPPPARYAWSQRLSRHGQVAMYTALNEATARAEVRGNVEDTFASLATFRTVVPLQVLDLTVLRSMRRPSIFNEVRRPLRSILPFLQDFTRAVTEAVDDRDATDGWIYEPTQRLADALRTYRMKNKKTLQGLIYPSSRGDSSNLVLFIEQSSVGTLGMQGSIDTVIVLDTAKTVYIPLHEGVPVV